MSVQMIQDRLNGYECRSALEEEQALREITQEIALAALGRTDFFRKAAFQGGTCLRIFHGVSRFSEDLDFSLQTPGPLDLTPYLEALTRELSVYGYALRTRHRPKAAQAVGMAFVKDDSLGELLELNYRPTTGPLRMLRVKLEVDTNPPVGASFEMKYMDFPFPSAVCLFDLPSLFAGKLHALLCREYLKGRDWYDFIWYTARRTPVNHALLSTALDQQGPWRSGGVQTDLPWCQKQLRLRIRNTDWKQARDDVRRFLKPVDLPSLEFWTREFFLAQLDKLV
ncbi:MAG: nucleotidyl transferase AbiEii/AbiGii toxin family protein [Planctomycetota bacterium]|nr:nucleotidyl transferase AbiEii/AbiGii toxin family protein [Planctomycetota bacterium]